MSGAAAWEPPGGRRGAGSAVGVPAAVPALLEALPAPLRPGGCRGSRRPPLVAGVLARAPLGAAAAAPPGAGGGSAAGPPPRNFLRRAEGAGWRRPALAGPPRCLRLARGYRHLPGAPRPEGQGRLPGRLVAVGEPAPWGLLWRSGLAAELGRPCREAGGGPARPGHLSASRAACGPSAVPLPLAGLFRLIPQAELLSVVFFRPFHLVFSRLLCPPLTWEVGGCAPGQPRLGVSRSTE